MAHVVSVKVRTDDLVELDVLTMQGEVTEHIEFAPSAFSFDDAMARVIEDHPEVEECLLFRDYEGEISVPYPADKVTKVAALDCALQRLFLDSVGLPN